MPIWINLVVFAPFLALLAGIVIASVRGARGARRKTAKRLPS